MLSNPVIQQALGAITTTLIEQLAASAAIRAYVSEQLGPTSAPQWRTSWLTPPSSTTSPPRFGTAVTQFLAYPGSSTALTDTIDQFADAVIDGNPAIAAPQTALAALEADPVYQAAVQTIVPGTLNSLLKNAAVREAIAAAARTAVIDLLKERGINNGFIDGIAGQVAEGTVDSFLPSPPAKPSSTASSSTSSKACPQPGHRHRHPSRPARPRTASRPGHLHRHRNRLTIRRQHHRPARRRGRRHHRHHRHRHRLRTDPVVQRRRLYRRPRSHRYRPNYHQEPVPTLPAPGELYLISATVPVPHAAAATTDTVVLAAITTAGPDTTQADVLDIQMTIPAPQTPTPDSY